MTAKEDSPRERHNRSGTDSGPDWESLARDEFAVKLEHSAAQLVSDAYTRLAIAVRRGEPAGEEVLNAFSRSVEALDTYVLTWARRGEKMDEDVMHSMEVGIAIFTDFIVTARSLRKGSFDEDDLDRIRRGLGQAERLLEELGDAHDVEVDDEQ